MNELDLEIEPGERVLLLGASGSGKSTLLHALAGVLGGDEEGEQQGELTLDSQAPADARGRAGLVLQDPDSQVILARVGDDVAFGCENLGVPREETWRRVAESLDAVGLRLPFDHPTSTLSGGQKQRLALAGVLAMRPGLLLFDEPTANLDAAGVHDVREAVARVAEDTGATLVVVEHRVEVWRHLVDRVIVLGEAGGVIADGSPREVLQRQGAALAEGGVWVPEHPPAHPARARRAGVELLAAQSLGIGRVPPFTPRKAPRAGMVLRSGLVVAVREGATLAITGANGSGKSTLGLTLAGLLPPLDGAVVARPVLAQGLGKHPSSWKSSQLLTRIATVFQDPEHQFLAPTVRRELEVGARVIGMGDRQTGERVDELLTRLRLDRLEAANPFTLSGGEKRRLSVATALVTSPRVLVLDEPTFGQDSRTWRELVALLAELLDAGSAVVAITHDADFVGALADSELRL